MKGAARLALALGLAAGAAGCRRGTADAPKAPKASQVIVERWRLIKELGPLQRDLADLEGKVFNATSTDAKLWRGYRERGRELKEEAETIGRHYATDVKWLIVIRTSSDPGLTEEFIRQANGYVSAARRSAAQLDDIIQRLYGMTRAPRSWTEKEFREAAARYQQTRGEMLRGGAEMARLLEKI